MKRKLFSYYRRWQELNHQGLTEDDFGGLRKFERAKAMGFLTAIVPGDVRTIATHTARTYVYGLVIPAKAGTQ